MIEQAEALRDEQTESVLRSNWKHLRIPYQLTLAPIFLWGCFLASPRPSWALIPAFVSFHLLLYSGITAYNSYYDRDRGPIGGLRNPPPIKRSLLFLALTLKAAGFLLAIAGGLTLAAIYATFVALSILYSHPRFRWKSDPWLSSATVCLGQGGLGFLAGWATATGGISGIQTATVLLGLMTACLTTLGMYPLTQLFQIEEDSVRGDRTLCVVLGPKSALALARAALLLGGGCGAVLLWLRGQPGDSALIGTGYLLIIAALRGIEIGLGRWTREELFRRVTLLHYTASAGFGIFILTRIGKWG